MNWFDTSGLTSLAKSALKEAQKTIDKALDIQDDSSEEQEQVEEATTSQSTEPPKESSDFFASWGLTASGESDKEIPNKAAVVTESPSKATAPSLWGSFAGSFFEQPKNVSEDAIVRPPKAKSMNLISENYDSQDDLFSTSKLVMSDGADVFESSKKEEINKPEDRRPSNRSNRLSLVSSHNSSESVEVLSYSVKTTPDSDGASVHTISNSSSTGPKINSESVEILPDSLISPSSIECLGFDSYMSDKNSDASTSPGDNSDKKSTQFGEATEKAATADSVSLVPDDDEDTMSYNSISECTVPTILGAEEKTSCEYLKVVRTEPKKTLDKEFIHLEQPVPQRMQISENSSNDGSWSDRTLHADADSLIDSNTADTKREEQDDILMEKLSDSSSFYNVNVSSDVLQSGATSFHDNEKQDCAEESLKDLVKETSRRPSPVSSDSKSDLVKIGSDRTSGHTSGDEIETATSSDIEIIPSPNGDNGNGYYRHSPVKTACKQSKFDGTTSPNLVDLVLGKSLATKIRGHNRELSEASVQSNNSDDSQGSENDRLMRRLCEMAEILEARENRLLEVTRSNAELVDSNADLKGQVEALLARHEAGDVTVITDDYTQRLSALEKKFQQAIREKDQLRKQLDTLKSETATRSRTEMESQLKERDDMIAQLQDEGEKLARQQLQQSNIIKKLRVKEKDNEQVIKSLRDKVADQSSDLDRLKRSISAKEEIEVSQIEAVYRLTTANKKLESDLMDTRSELEDTNQRLDSQRTSLEAARRELSELQRCNALLSARRDEAAALRDRCDARGQENERLRVALEQLRRDFQEAGVRHSNRESVLRAELAALSAREPPDPALPASLAAAAAARQRDRDALRGMRAMHAETKAELAKAIERERLLREEVKELKQAAAETAETEERGCQAEAAECPGCAALRGQIDVLTESCSLLQRQKAECEESLRESRERAGGLAAELQAATTRNMLLQERCAAAECSSVTSWPLPRAGGGGGGGAGDVSPTASLTSDCSHINIHLPQEESSASASQLESLLSQLTRRAGEVRSLRADCDRLRADRHQLRAALAATTHTIDHHQGLQEQYDALLLMYGEKEEQVQELTLDLRDLTQLYKAQLQELLTLRGH